MQSARRDKIDIIMTLRQLTKDILTRLTPEVGEGEARAMMREIIDDTMGLSPVDIVLRGDSEVLSVTFRRVTDIVARVVAGEPLQYVLGYARWRGLRLRVTCDTLIPRPETAALVDMIVDDFGGAKDVSVLDIGTGSGCIATALARDLPFARVTALDISESALAVARDNATSAGVAVTFVCGDVLTMKSPEAPCYDVIVSNPPYIAHDEASRMEARVLDHEPTLALFAPEGDPLAFYRATARYAAEALRHDGKLYFEINPLFVTPLCDMLKDTGFGVVDIVRDYCGRNRFAICRR